MKIALLVLDAVRTDYLGPYDGDPAITPTLNHLAEHGLTFTNCIAGAPWTPASHATMFTGQYPSTHGVRADNLSHPSEGHYLTESLREAGVRTQGVGSEPWLSRRQGFNRGFDKFHDTGGHNLRHYAPLLPAGLRYALDKVRCRLGTSDGTDRFDLHLFRHWAKTTDSFSFHNISVAHSPYNPPEAFRGSAEGEPLPDTPFVSEQPFFRYIAGEVNPTSEEWNAVRRRYAEGVSHADHLLGRAIEQLDDDTWIIITADHGELLGEDGLAVHQFSLRDELINVPLIIAHSSLEPKVINDLVHHVDIAPTLYHIAARAGFNCEYPGPDLPGRSLLSLVRSTDLSSSERETTQSDPSDERAGGRVVFAEYGPPVVATNTLLNNADSVTRETLEQYFVGLQAAVTKEFKLIRRTGHGDRLVRRDEESRDVTDECPELARELSNMMDQNLDPLPAVEPTELDNYVEPVVQKRLEHLGYA